MSGNPPEGNARAIAENLRHVMDALFDAKSKASDVLTLAEQDYENNDYGIKTLIAGIDIMIREAALNDSMWTGFAFHRGE